MLGSSCPPERRQTLLSAVRAYQQHPHRRRARARPAAFALGGMRVLDYGGDGPPVLLVPSLINPSWVLDLEPRRSLVRDLRQRGHRCFLIDWGEPTGEELGFDIGDYITRRLLPVISALPGPLALVGYCLGGTMALAAAQLAADRVRALALIAAPWRFAAYPGDSRRALEDFWRQHEPAARQLGRLPMEILQLAFWAQDAESTGQKYIDFAALDPDSAAARRFVLLEDWANSGPPLAYPAARMCFEDFFAADMPGRGCGASATRRSARTGSKPRWRSSPPVATGWCRRPPRLPWRRDTVSAARWSSAMSAWSSARRPAASSMRRSRPGSRGPSSRDCLLRTESSLQGAFAPKHSGACVSMDRHPGFCRDRLSLAASR
ncbi:alpha/beta fold hydrolase [Hankyongella ginsenosidimutans]|uniref:Alpha/beta fold hydrolase n=1 Tax=Hankyongella ginsenosidimutans TaxID=1763828 RepID=A0A4D7CA56_9SPHN|nr:alpha/beta fold hydrolase [Hankyongella ginsenosidimutans]QCI80093.1 alpha/beta fold hydrolase [Hankyongella ginsenosidimutans]